MTRKTFLPLTLMPLLIGLALSVPVLAATPTPPPGPTSSSTGLEATISSPPPASAPTIAVPASGQTFTSEPITVSGLCSAQTVKIFSNNVFIGAANCANGSYSLQVDLFSGQNDLTAVQFDALGQQSPSSSAVSETFVSAQFAQFGTLMSLSSTYARRGANPGQVLNWPLEINGGQAPYAISVDWGDGKSAELLSEASAGQFNATHTYNSAGTYVVIVKATDAHGETAFLQLVGVANGQTTSPPSSNSTKSTTIYKTEVLWWPLIVLTVLIVMAFWLGRRQQLASIRSQLEKSRRS